MSGFGEYGVSLLTRKTDYALVAMAHLARQGDALVSAREIAVRSRVPLPVLTNILNALAHYGLVTSARGAKGGYRLARPPTEITLVNLIEAIEGPVTLTMCAPDPRSAFEQRCRLEAFCVARDPARRVHRSLRRFLSQVTLAQIASDTEPSDAEPVLVGAEP